MHATSSDYLVVGSGLAALSFAALMAKSGKGVRVVEAHTLPGGYGHTFAAGDYKFNAQLHYVWNCGEGRTVNRVLKKLGVEREVTFVEYDRNGFDHMRMPGYALDIPGDQNLLKQRLRDLFPLHRAATDGFLDEVWATADELDNLPSAMNVRTMIRRVHRLTRVLRYRKATLQDVFDRFEVPPPAQTLLALQWPDFLLPPAKLSFFAWVMLFVGYTRGAYYPTKHFEHVIDTLVATIVDNGGEVVFGQQIVEFKLEAGRMVGARAEVINERGEGIGEFHNYAAGEVVCNMDPRQAAEMIGLSRFSKQVRRKLDYDYSHSNFMAYCAVKGVDLREHGFGRHNLFHTDEPDLNRAFHAMERLGDYSRPSFAMTTPSLLTDAPGDCPEGTQLVELLTVADFDRFRHLRFANMRAYHDKKREIFDAIVGVIEREYVPNFREHIC
ncbi:MAG: phytoene desaturase family protein, partial [Nannocystaceae bacterium]